MLFNIFFFLVVVIYLDGKKALKEKSEFNEFLALRFCEYSLKKNLVVENVDLEQKWPKNEKIQKLIIDDFFLNL
jgi:hypothetical protein